ncbi:acyl-CoA dehydrogenase family protein [Micromonospora sp. NPDC051925]|uniref:acyl-CoA dehydrogenase family protein n=1 Tax=Micromonospora sp. NPDC051925 TaxID=3364288 RepID=UPI0037C7B0BD
MLHAVRRLTPELTTRAADIEQAREIPADLLDALRTAGCFRMFVPRSHGGYEVDLRTGMTVLETLARADGSTGWTVMIGAETPQLLAMLPRDRFGPPAIGRRPPSPPGGRRTATVSRTACSRTRHGGRPVRRPSAPGCPSRS